MPAQKKARLATLQAYRYRPLHPPFRYLEMCPHYAGLYKLSVCIYQSAMSVQQAPSISRKGRVCLVQLITAFVYLFET